MTTKAEDEVTQGDMVRLRWQFSDFAGISLAFKLCSYLHITHTNSSLFSISLKLNNNNNQKIREERFDSIPFHCIAYVYM